MAPNKSILHAIVVSVVLMITLVTLPHESLKCKSVKKNASPCSALWQRKMTKHAQLMSGRRLVLPVDSLADQTRFSDRTSYDPFEPTYTCHSEYRRGTMLGDGGKFVCGDPEYFKAQSRTNGEKCLVYSVGSSGDASFEQETVAELGCEVHTFDPTGNSTSYASILESAGAQFHAIGVSGAPSAMLNEQTGVSSQLLPIRDIVASLGHTRRYISILKIDCEGCEYGAFEALWPHIETGEIYIGQIQIEMHGTDFRKISSFFKRADEAGYMIFHKERNHWGCMGYLCVEFSLIYKKEANRIFDFMHCKQ